MKARLTWFGVATAAMLALTGAASAVPLTLTGPIGETLVGPQSTSNPCIIAGTLSASGPLLSGSWFQ